MPPFLLYGINFYSTSQVNNFHYNKFFALQSPFFPFLSTLPTFLHFPLQFLPLAFCPFLLPSLYVSSPSAILCSFRLFYIATLLSTSFCPLTLLSSTSLQWLLMPSSSFAFPSSFAICRPSPSSYIVLHPDIIMLLCNLEFTSPSSTFDATT